MDAILRAALVLSVCLPWAELHAAPAKNAMCIYGSASSILRRIFVPDQEEQHASNQLTLPGESFVLTPLPADDVSCRAAIQSKTSKPSPDPTTAVVVSGVVQQVLMLDPALDSAAFPSATLVPSTIAKTGDQWNGVNFLRRYISADKTTGLVLQANLLNPANPVNPVAGSVFGESATIQVGAIIPVTPKVPALGTLP